MFSSFSTLLSSSSHEWHFSPLLPVLWPPSLAERPKHCSILPDHITARIRRNANSSQPDPMSLRLLPKQPPWNQHPKPFRHSHWDISIFIVRNHPYFTSPSTAAPITLALPESQATYASYFGAHIFRVFQSGKRYTHGWLKLLEEPHRGASIMRPLSTSDNVSLGSILLRCKWLENSFSWFSISAK